MADTPFDPLPVDPTTQSTSAPGGARRGRIISSLLEEARRSNQDRSQHAAEMQKRLADPQLRAQQRTHIDAMHPDLAQVVGLEPQTARDLIDLLTDQEMAQLDRSWGDGLQATNSAGIRGRFARNAQEGARRIEEIRNLLGEQGFERYRDYQATLRERLEVALFEERLQQDDGLTPDQRNRLMDLLRQHIQERQRRHLLERPGSPQPPTADREALRQQNIAANEKAFWRMQEDSRQLISRVREVLTLRQIEVFAQMEAEKIESQRQFVEQMRADAGMSWEIPPPARTDDGPERQPIEGQVRLELSVSMDGGEPLMLCLLVENGKAVSFEGPASLWIEATPLLLDDGCGNVSFDFCEQRDGRRRVIGSMGMGIQTQHQKGVPLGATRARTSISGSRVYTIELDARVTPVEREPTSHH